LRTALQGLLANISSLPASCTAPAATTTLHLPVYTRTFSDFLCSAAHILNAGQAMRGTALPLPPSFLNVPIGYTGCSSSLIVSGVDIVRPKGLVKGKQDDEFVFQPSERLDYELEVGVVIGKSTIRGESVGSAEVADYIFGLVLVNDWSGEFLICALLRYTWFSCC
jgi:fumarylacetoacetase